MAKESSEERQFSDNLDKLLAGVGTEPAEKMSEDCRTAVDFARRLTSLRDEPSPRFKQQTRNRLLARLVEQEAARQKEERHRPWGSLGRLLSLSPVWRTATVTIAVAVLALAVIWQSGLFNQPEGDIARRAPAPESAPPPQTAAAAAPTPAPLLELRPLETISAKPGEAVRVELVFTNTGPQSIELAPFPPAIHVAQSGTDKVVRSFAAGKARRAIQASETVTYALLWDQKDDNGRQVGPGRYFVFIDDLVFGTGTQPDETRRSFGRVVDVLIQSP
ncbi:MAG: hypothetical protein HW414_1413 [Dehalococcoidia bacterium]|nr:hypothetical protein [Dehalococcoidia bacterium]